MVIIEFTAVLLLAALVKKLVDFVKLITDGNTKGVFVQLGAWVAGWVATALVAYSPWGDSVAVGDIASSELGVVGIIVAGLLIGSAGSVLYDYSPTKIQPTSYTRVS